LTLLRDAGTVGTRDTGKLVLKKHGTMAKQQVAELDSLEAILGHRFGFTSEPTALAYTRLDAHRAMSNNPRSAHRVAALAAATGSSDA
jgi:hypothetical protein